MNSGFEYNGISDKISNLQSIWITDGFKDEKPIDWAKAFAYHLVKEKANDPLHHLKGRDGLFKSDRGRPIFRKKLSTTQLRKFFGDLKSLEANTSSQSFDLAKVKMMKPKLAYAVGKDKSDNPKIKDLYFEFERALNAIAAYEHFKNFMQLFEAVVAYHKYYENHAEINTINA